MEHVRIAEHAVECLASATAPSCHSDAAEVDEGILACEILHSACLVFAGECTHFAVDTLAPFTSARAVGSAVVYTDDYVALVGKVLMP